MAIGGLAAAIDELFEEGPATCADGESVIGLLHQLTRLEAFATDAVGAFDVSGAWSADGARSAPAWLASCGGVAKGEARRRTRRAHHLGHLPRAREAFGRGELSAAHVDALIRVDRPVTEDALVRDEALLVDKAKTLGFDDFATVLAYWDQCADPDGTEERAEAQRTRRDVTVTQSFQGTWLGTVTLDPLAGTIVAGELDRLEEALFATDWAEAQERLGGDPRVADLSRTPAQRRADALVEMATRSKSCPDEARRPTPLLTVLVDWPTLSGRICELANGTVVTPGSLLPYLDEAMVERAVFTPDRRVEVSARQRFFTGATRRAIELRDRICQHPTCDLPAERCEADHVVPYRDDGPTIQANGRMLCGFHNRLRNVTEGRSPPGDEG